VFVKKVHRLLECLDGGEDLGHIMAMMAISLLRKVKAYTMVQLTRLVILWVVEETQHAEPYSLPRTDCILVSINDTRTVETTLTSEQAKLPVELKEGSSQLLA
jgi:hypothetical protein